MGIRKIYRYQPCDPDRIEGISSGRIWVSDPSKFNDSTDLDPEFKDDFNGPFRDADHMIEIVTQLYKENPELDGFWLLGDSADEQTPAYILKNAKHCSFFQDQLASALVRRVKTFGVTCFADSPDLTLMWAHYAKSSSGFCLEYEFSYCIKETLIKSPQTLFAIDWT